MKLPLTCTIRSVKGVSTPGLAPFCWGMECLDIVFQIYNLIKRKHVLPCLHKLSPFYNKARRHGEKKSNDMLDRGVYVCYY